jgi:hypothetical protein
MSAVEKKEEIKLIAILAFFFVVASIPNLSTFKNLAAKLRKNICFY